MNRNAWKAFCYVASLLTGHVVFNAHASDADENAIEVRDDKGQIIKDRFVSEKGQTISVTVKNAECRFNDVKFDEKERHSRFGDDLRAIIGKVVGGAQTRDLKPCPDITKPYTLRYDRATLTIRAVSVSTKDDQTVTVITGPKEHLYLGLDLPVSQRKTLKYDSSSQSLQPQSDNPQLYLSVNYYFGDLASADDARKWYERFSIKALALASKRPLDSFGLGAGYQVPKIAGLGLDLSSTSLFVGRFWTKQDAIASNGSRLSNGSTTHDWRIGITYDVGAGLKWLKLN